jgi:N-acetylglucosaminyldiphosphoundecaprenol N-acetyl-beta-D-mannosaminyltransferase
VENSLYKTLVLGQPIDLGDDYLTWLWQRYRSGSVSHVITINAEMILLAKSNSVFAEIVRRAELVMPDGSGIIYYLKMQGIRQSRQTGIGLAEALLRKAAEEGDTCGVFLYGGRPEVIDRAVAKWELELPNLNILGYRHGYIDDIERENLVDDIIKLQPKVILVAMGAPRQEIWIDRHKHLCPNSIWVGVGGSFDVWSGLKKRAPVWMQKSGLEWLYRVAQEPSRWRRLLALPHFVWLAILEKILPKIGFLSTRNPLPPPR